MNKKIILTLALFVGLAVIGKAQNTATNGNGNAAKPKPVIEVVKPDVTPSSAPAPTDANPAASNTPAAKKSVKKTCCKKKASSCCKRKIEAIRED